MSDAAKAAITNIFVLMLENHSFDNMLGRSGIPGLRVAPADASNSYDGQTYKVKSPAPWCMTTDPGHEYIDALQQLCGADAFDRFVKKCRKEARGFIECAGCSYPPVDNSGFASSYATSVSEDTGRPQPGNIGDIMACFDTPAQLPVLYTLATEFAVCDAWHSALPGPTWPNRFFVHGASSSGMNISPSFGDEAEWEAWRGLGFEYANGSIYDALDARQHQWKLYQDKDNGFSDRPSHWDQGGWISQVAAIKNIGLERIDNLTKFADDINARDHDGKPSYIRYPYTFIEPNFGASFFSPQPGGDGKGPRYTGGSSQHPEDNCYGGEGLIKYVYETIRNSPVWETSLLIIVYDEHGGFYDSAGIPEAAEPGDHIHAKDRKLNEYCFDFSVLGVRVPAVIVSPWIAKSHVDHTRYDHSSVIATLTRKLGMGPLTKRDTAAADLWPLLTESAPRSDCPTTLPDPVLPPQGSDYETGAAPDNRHEQPLPRSGNAVGFLHVLLKTEIELAQKCGGRAAEDIIADFRKIETHADASAYVGKVKAMLDAL